MDGSLCMTERNEKTRGCRRHLYTRKTFNEQGLPYCLVTGKTPLFTSLPAAMGALLSVQRAFKLVKRIPTLPLPEIYRGMTRSSVVTAFTGIIYLATGFYRISREELVVGILMVVASVFCGFAIASHAYNKYTRTVDSMYISAVASVLYGLLLIAVIVAEFTLGFQVLTLLIFIILIALGQFVNIGVTLYTAIIVVERLKAGENPRLEGNENAISGTVSVLQEPFAKEGP